MSRALDRILPPYTRRIDSLRHRLARGALLTGVFMLACLIGLMLVLLPIQVVFIPALPMLLMIPFVFWLMPDTDANFDRPIVSTYLAFLAIAIGWPNYLALELPGLPWISFDRLMMIALVLITLYALASSARLRDEVADVFATNTAIKWLMLTFIALQFLTIPLGPALSLAIKQGILNQFNWTFMLIMTAWIVSRPGNAIRISHVLLWATAFVVAWVPLEVRMQQPPWAQYIPSFLKIDPELLDVILGSQARSSDGIYRARSVFTVSLVMTEYLSLAVPFVLHKLFSRGSARGKWLCAILYVFIFYAVLASNSRSGVIGLLLAHLLYPGLYALKRQLRLGKVRDLLAPSLLGMYPVAVAAMVGLIFGSQQVYNRVFGHSGNAASNEGRKIQWEMLWPKLGRNPLGHGPGNATEVLGAANLAGKATIDSYPINLLLDYGVLGFVVFVALMFTAVWLGFRTYFRARDIEEELAGPATVAIISFLVVKLVLSTDTNQYLVFALIGLIVGLAWRQNRPLPS